MFTLKIYCRPRVSRLFSGVEKSPKLLSLGQLEGASQVEILRSIIALQIASTFGVGNQNLRPKLTEASCRIVEEIGEEDGGFFLSLLDSTGLHMDGYQMQQAKEIIYSFRSKIPSLDDLLKHSFVQ